MQTQPAPRPEPPAIIPEPDRAYEIHSFWRGERHSFDVAFTPTFIDILRQAGGAVDLAQGDLVYSRGLRRDVFGARVEFEKRTGAKAPAWLFRWPSEREPFVLPRGRVVVDADPESASVVIVPPQACVPVFACLMAPYLGRPVQYDESSFVPLAPRRWRPEHRRVHPGIELVAENRTGLGRAAAVFDAVCGRAARAWAARRPLVEARMGEAFRLSTALLDAIAAGRRNEAIDEAVAYLGPPPPCDRGPAQLVEALASVRRRLEAEVMPVSIVVVPPGLHFSALPEMKELRAQVTKPPVAFDEHGVMVSSSSPLQSATVVVHGRRLVFLPAEDLEDLQISSRHELYHLLEAQLVTAEQRRRLDAFHADTVANAGPFARPYGFLRQEFLPTMGEVYEGAYGEEGIAWLRRYHAELSDFLDEVTGGERAAAPLTTAAGRRRR